MNFFFHSLVKTFNLGAKNGPVGMEWVKRRALQQSVHRHAAHLDDAGGDEVGPVGLAAVVGVAAAVLAGEPPEEVAPLHHQGRLEHVLQGDGHADGFVDDALEVQRLKKKMSACALEIAK